jgi:hypothetical protein
LGFDKRQQTLAGWRVLKTFIKTLSVKVLTITDQAGVWLMIGSLTVARQLVIKTRFPVIAFRIIKKSKPE